MKCIVHILELEQRVRIYLSYVVTRSREILCIEAKQRSQTMHKLAERLEGYIVSHGGQSGVVRIEESIEGKKVIWGKRRSRPRPYDERLEPLK